jgi:ubiquinone/menaquinone biosynthesis C-methylase UbiE
VQEASGSVTRRDVEQFNARAERYDGSAVGRHFHRRIQQVVLRIGARLMPEPRAVLDIGCGTGSLLRLAAARFPAAQLCGVDPAEQMLRVANGSLGGEPRVRLVGAPAEQLPFDDAAFDLVVSSNSFHHWIDQGSGIREIGRVLAPGGCLVVTDPFAVGWLRPWAVLIRKRDRMRSRFEVEAMLRGAGLEALAWEAVFGLGPVTTFFAVTARRQ